MSVYRNFLIDSMWFTRNLSKFHPVIPLSSIQGKQKRNYGNRPNFKHPVPLTYERKLMLETVKPIYPDKPRVCENVTKVKKTYKEIVEENPYAMFLSRKLIRRLNEYNIILIFHENTYTGHDYINVKGLFYDNDFKIYFWRQLNGHIAKYALKGTKWEPALVALTSPTALGFTNESNISLMLKLLKKCPQYILLGMITENRLLSRADIEELAKLTSIDVVRGNLCNTLTLASGLDLTRSLDSNQLTLTNSLQLLSENKCGNQDNQQEQEKEDTNKT